MSFTSFCFLAQWLYCVLGYEFKGQGVDLVQWLLLFSVVLHLKELKDGPFLSFLVEAYMEMPTAFVTFSKDFP